MTLEALLDWLDSPNAAGVERYRTGIPARVNVGGDKHTGTISVEHVQTDHGVRRTLRVRDSSKSSMKQYVTVTEHFIDGLEIKVGSRYKPVDEAVSALDDE